MTRTAFAALLSLALAGSAAAQPAPAAIVGTWKAATDEGVIVIAPCGPTFCGKLTDSLRIRANPDTRDFKNRDPALRDRRVTGMTMLQGFTGGPTEWKGGTLYNPDDGGTYTGKIVAEGAGRPEADRLHHLPPVPKPGVDADEVSRLFHAGKTSERRAGLGQPLGDVRLQQRLHGRGDAGVIAVHPRPLVG